MAVSAALRAAITRAQNADQHSEPVFSPLRGLGRGRLTPIDLLGQSLSTIAPATGMVFIAPVDDHLQSRLRRVGCDCCDNFGGVSRCVLHHSIHAETGRSRIVVQLRLPRLRYPGDTDGGCRTGTRVSRNLGFGFLAGSSESARYHRHCRSRRARNCRDGDHDGGDCPGRRVDCSARRPVRHPSDPGRRSVLVDSHRRGHAGDAQ